MASGASPGAPGSPRPGLRVLGASCLALLWPGALLFGYPGVLGAHWGETLGLSRAAVGATLFFALAAVGSGMFPVGRWQGRPGVTARRLVLAGEVLTAASLLFTARPGGAWSLYAWGFTAGAASCLVYLPCLTAVQLWFPRHRGLASGVVNLGFAGSAALAAPVLGWALGALGYAGMHYALAAAVLVVGGGAARWVAPPAGLPGRPSMGSEGVSLTPRHSLGTRAFWLLWGTWALQGAAGIAMVTLAVPLGLSRGAPFAAALWVLTCFNLANGWSRIAVGFLSDRVGRRPVLCAASLAAAGAYYSLPGVGSLWATAALAAVVGVAFGTLFTVSAPLAVECFGPAHFGAILGLVFTAYGFLSGILGPWLAGTLLDTAGGDPAAACRYLGALCAAAGLLVLGVRPPRPREGSS
ncbi:MAG: MFS transporter [Thermodesulfobacteriota bacterium]